MDRQSLLKMFGRAEDKLVCGKVLDQAFACETRHTKTYTDFLDPARAQKLLDALSRERDFGVLAHGGFEGAERVMLGFCPLYETLAPSDFPIARLRIRFDRKFAKTVRHQDFLGAMLGLGVDRSRLGDIVIYEREAFAFAERAVADFLETALTKVGSAAVETAIAADAEDDVFAVAPVEEQTFTAASNRIDALAAACFRLSRGEAQELAAKGKLFLNWTPVNGAKAVSEGDTVSARGVGRFRVIEIGETKKERVFVRVLK